MKRIINRKRSQGNYDLLHFYQSHKKQWRISEAGAFEKSDARLRAYNYKREFFGLNAASRE